jgi:hypothetical protein
MHSAGPLILMGQSLKTSDVRTMLWGLGSSADDPDQEKSASILAIDHFIAKSI